METNERILEFIDYKGISVSAFERSIGKSTNYVRNSKSFTSNVLATIMSVYPELSMEWLITGEGYMLKNEKRTTLDEYNSIATSENSTPLQREAKNVIKYYPSVNGSMGGVQFLDDPEESYVDIIMPGFSECKYAINAYGDSMHPVIKSGQIILLMEWTEKFIDWGRIYLVVTKSGYRTIKYLKPADNSNAIRCESENKESNPAFEIEKEDVLKLFLVKGWVCRDAI